MYVMHIKCAVRVHYGNKIVEKQVRVILFEDLAYVQVVCKKLSISVAKAAEFSTSFITPNEWKRQI